MKFPVKLFFCFISDSTRLEEDKINVEAVYDYMDYVIAIDGSHNDESLKDYLRSIDKDNKVIHVEAPWENNFPAQRSKYLDTIGSLLTTFNIKNTSNWVCRLDSDEHYSPKLIEHVRRICASADEKGVDMLAIRVHDISLDKEGNELANTVGETYHKGLIYKWYSHLQYLAGGNHTPVHEGYNHVFNGTELDNKSGQNKETPYYYEHIKAQGDVWKRAHARNFLIGGGGPNLGEKQPLWKPYVSLVEDVMGKKITDWKDYDDYLVKGNIDQRLKDWFIRYMFDGVENKPIEWKNYVGDKELIGGIVESLAELQLGFSYDGASEVRESYKYYYRWLHLEEEPKELRDVNIP